MCLDDDELSVPSIMWPFVQCTLYWSVPGATPPSPPSSPEKEEAENKIEAESGSPTQPDTAKTIQALLQHRIQQLQQNNKQYMRNVSDYSNATV